MAKASSEHVNRALLRLSPRPSTPPPSPSLTLPSEITILSTVPCADTPELPTFDIRYSTEASRYIYGVSHRGNLAFADGLLKHDTQTQTAVARVVHAQSLGEPLYVADPEGTEEDDGVCLSVVLDGTRGRSYLLCLDVRTFEEVVMPFGFHGSHVACS